jgi:hypothetical protein
MGVIRVSKEEIVHRADTNIARRKIIVHPSSRKEASRAEHSSIKQCHQLSPTSIIYITKTAPTSALLQTGTIY